MKSLRRLSLLAAAVATIAMAAPVSAAPAASNGSNGGNGGGQHPTGLVRTPVSKEGVTPFAQSLMTSVASYPVSVDLSQWAPPVGNQGSVGSCASWATGYYERYWLRNHGVGETTLFAPMYLYAQISKGVDAGSSFPGNFSIMNSQGIAPQSVYWQGNYDYTTQPDAAEKAAAATYKTTSYSMLFSGASSNNQNAVMAAMANGQTVMFGIPVYPEFDRATASNPLIGTPTAGETSRGGHGVFAAKYDEQGVWIENSWGTSWGAAGWGELSWAFINQYAFEAWTLSSATVDVPDGTTVVASFTPSSGTVGSSVTINGLGFTGATDVSFNGTSQPAFTVVSDTQITTTVPAGATSGYISVAGLKNTGTSLTTYTVTQPTSTLTNNTTSAYAGKTVNLSARLTNASGTGLANKTVSMSFNSGAPASLTTDANGYISMSALMPMTAGTYPVALSWAGDGIYLGTTTNSSVKVSLMSTRLAFVGPASVKKGSLSTFNATLKGADGSWISGATVTLSFNGKTYTGTTNGSGQVSWTGVLAPAKQGNAKAVISYTGANGNASSSLTVTLKVTA